MILMRVIAGCALAFTLASVPAFLTVLATQAMSRDESAFALVVFYGIGWFCLFGIGSAAGLYFGGVRRKKLGVGTLTYACGGAVAGLLIAFLQRAHSLGGSHAAVLGAFAIPLLMPWLVGGVILALWLRLTKRSHGGAV